jgi:hypothetical protein
MQSLRPSVRRRAMDPISFDDEIIHWSGFVFSFWAERGRERILCKMKREAIREFPEFKHASRREIAIEAGHVAELLEPILRRKIEDGEFSPKSSATRKVVVVTDVDVRRFSH